MSGSKSYLKLLMVMVVGSLVCPAYAQNVEVNWNDVHQVIDGFGGSDASYRTDLTQAQADAFFSAAHGLGLSLLRVAAYTKPGQAVPLCKTMQEAVAHGAKVWASEWSPPAAWKSNDSLDHGGYLLPRYYQDYANFQTQYVKDVKLQCGVALYAFSIQNEPNFNASYPSADWSGENFRDYVMKNLGPTFASNGIMAKIMISEETSWAFGEATATLSDPNASKYVSIVGVHDYHGNPSPYPLAQKQGKHLWETETSDFKPPDSKMDSALHYATLIHEALVNANANAWHYWWLIDAFGKRDNEGLTMPDGRLTKRLFMMGNFSKFIRPGYFRIDATADPAPGVLVSAFKDLESGNFVIVAINNGRSSIPVSFSFKGFTASVVTPWVTNHSLNLARRPSVLAGNGFTFSLSAGSITTFIGKDTAVPSRSRALNPSS